MSEYSVYALVSSVLATFVEVAPEENVDAVCHAPLTSRY